MYYIFLSKKTKLINYDKKVFLSFKFVSHAIHTCKSSYKSLCKK